VIIDTDDVLLVMDKSRAQEVKKILKIHAAKQEDWRNSEREGGSLHD